MNIKELVKDAHENAKTKGWHDEDRTFGELIALCHAELSEALEEYRRGIKMDVIYFKEWSIKRNGKLEDCKKPEGIPIELADCVIRIADMCGKYGIDLDEAIKIKMEYNKLRSHKHGGKVI